MWAQRQGFRVRADPMVETKVQQPPSINGFAPNNNKKTQRQPHPLSPQFKCRKTLTFNDSDLLSDEDYGNSEPPQPPPRKQVQSNVVKSLNFDLFPERVKQLVKQPNNYGQEQTVTSTVPPQQTEERRDQRSSINQQTDQLIEQRLSVLEQTNKRLSHLRQADQRDVSQQAGQRITVYREPEHRPGINPLGDKPSGIHLKPDQRFGVIQPAGRAIVNHSYADQRMDTQQRPQTEQSYRPKPDFGVTAPQVQTARDRTSTGNVTDSERSNARKMLRKSAPVTNNARRETSVPKDPTVPATSAPFETVPVNRPKEVPTKVQKSKFSFEYLSNEPDHAYFPQKSSPPPNQPPKVTQVIHSEPAADTDTLTVSGSGTGRNITVCVRKRPLLTSETKRKEMDMVKINLPGKVTVNAVKISLNLQKYIQQHVFNFDEAFGEHQSNTEVYMKTIKPLIKLVFQRACVMCFAFGQTGAGKSYTLLGNKTIPGLYQLASHDMFDVLKQHESCSLWVSYYEIYNNQLYDLLNKRKRIHVRENSHQKVCIAGLMETRVASVAALVQVIKFGNGARSTGSTGVNDRSSRSHAVLQLEVRDRVDAKIGRLSFIDLAGSERAADVTNSDKQTRLEGAGINQSLLALKECIRSIGMEKGHTPFRQSKLTHILRDSFMGKSHTVMIANISPSQSACENTLNALRYADRVRNLPNTTSLSESGLLPDQESPPSKLSEKKKTPTNTLFHPSNIQFSSTPIRQEAKTKQATTPSFTVNDLPSEIVANAGNDDSPERLLDNKHRERRVTYEVLKDPRVVDVPGERNSNSHSNEVVELSPHMKHLRQKLTFSGSKEDSGIKRDSLEQMIFQRSSGSQEDPGSRRESLERMLSQRSSGSQEDPGSRRESLERMMSHKSSESQEDAASRRESLERMLSHRSNGSQEDPASRRESLERMLSHRSNESQENKASQRESLERLMSYQSSESKEEPGSRRESLERKLSQRSSESKENIASQQESLERMLFHHSSGSSSSRKISEPADSHNHSFVKVPSPTTQVAHVVDTEEEKSSQQTDSSDFTTSESSGTTASSEEQNAIHHPDSQSPVKQSTENEVEQGLFSPISSHKPNMDIHLARRSVEERSVHSIHSSNGSHQEIPLHGASIDNSAEKETVFRNKSAEKEVVFSETSAEKRLLLSGDAVMSRETSESQRPISNQQYQDVLTEKRPEATIQNPTYHHHSTDEDSEAVHAQPQREAGIKLVLPTPETFLRTISDNMFARHLLAKNLLSADKIKQLAQKVGRESLPGNDVIERARHKPARHSLPDTRDQRQPIPQKQTAGEPSHTHFSRSQPEPSKNSQYISGQANVKARGVQEPFPDQTQKAIAEVATKERSQPQHVSDNRHFESLLDSPSNTKLAKPTQVKSHALSGATAVHDRHTVDIPKPQQTVPPMSKQATMHTRDRETERNSAVEQSARIPVKDNITASRSDPAVNQPVPADYQLNPASSKSWSDILARTNTSAGTIIGETADPNIAADKPYQTVPVPEHAEKSPIHVPGHGAFVQIKSDSILLKQSQITGNKEALHLGIAKQKPNGILITKDTNVTFTKEQYHVKVGASQTKLNSAVIKEKIPSVSFLPIHPFPRTHVASPVEVCQPNPVTKDKVNVTDAERLRQTVSGNIATLPAPDQSVKTVTSLSNGPQNTAKQEAQDKIVVQKQQGIVAAHENQLHEITLLCKHEMDILIALQQGKKEFKSYVTSLRHILTKKSSLINNLENLLNDKA